MVWGSINTGMTRTFGLLALALAVSQTPALAQTAPVTVGVFDADRILAESLAGKQALALFTQLRDQRGGEVQAQQIEFNTLRQQGLQAIPGSPQAVVRGPETEHASCANPRASGRGGQRHRCIGCWSPIHATLSGPGTVYLQSLPSSRLAAEIPDGWKVMHLAAIFFCFAHDACSVSGPRTIAWLSWRRPGPGRSLV